MGANHPPCAQDDPVPPKHPRRIWVEDSWIESMTIRREANGQFAKKHGNEPPSQLMLFGREAA